MTLPSQAHPFLSNPDLLHLCHSHLTSSDLLTCLTVSKLWNRVACHHLWSSNPLVIPSRKSDNFLRARLPQTSAAYSQSNGSSTVSCSAVRALVLNLSRLHKSSIFVKERENLDLTIIFPAIRSLTLANSLLLSPFLLVPLSQVPGSALNHGNLIHRSHKQRLRQIFYQNLVKQIASFTGLAHLVLINFEPTLAAGSTPDPQEDRNGIPKSRQFDINDLLLALADAFSQKPPVKSTPFRCTALKSLNITKSRELVDSSLAALSRLAPLYDNYEHRRLSFDLTSITLVNCPLITANGFMTFLRTCHNLTNLKLGKMDNLFRTPASYSQLVRDPISVERKVAPSDCEIQDQLGIVEQMVCHCSQLRCLTIEDITIPLTIIAGVIDRPIGVTRLHLTRCQPTVAFLTFFGSLRDLSLNHCLIDDPFSRDYGFLARAFSQLQRLSLLSIGTRSFTFTNLDQLLATSIGLRTLMVDGNGRALRSTDEEALPQALDYEVDLLAEALTVHKHSPNDHISVTHNSEAVHSLPASVRSVFGNFDILASQVPSNVLVLLLSAAQALEGVGLFGQADEHARDSNRVIRDRTSVELKAPAPLQLAGRLLDRLKRWSDRPVLLDRSARAFPPFSSRKPIYRRSHTFWLYDRSSPATGMLYAEGFKVCILGTEKGISKRLVSAEIQLLKSKCANLANVWV